MTDATTGPKQPEQGQKLKYVDRLVLLNNDALLICRVLVDQNHQHQNALTVYRPLQIFNEEHDVFMRKWLPPSSDDVYVIPLAQVLTMATPNPMIVQTFEQIISGPYNEYIVDEQVDEGEEEMPNVPDPEGPIYH